MANVRELKRRIKSVENISQVTRAMQMVAASKMRRAQEQVLATRPYSAKAWQVATHLVAQYGSNQASHPLLTHRDEIRATGIVFITSDKGLCGGYNGSIIRATLKFMRGLDHPVRLVTVGRRGRDFMARHGVHIVAEYSEIPDRPSVLDIAPIARTVIDDFLSEEFDEVYLAYTEFVNTLVQEPVLRRLLPFPLTAEEKASSVSHKYVSETPERELSGDYIYEPNPETILSALLPDFTELQIYQAILESLASEHSARMVAMRNATDNAHDLIEHLTLRYYRARQEAITGEMVDIVGGVEALK